MSYNITNSDTYFQIPSVLPDSVLDSLVAQCIGLEDKLTEGDVFVGNSLALPGSPQPRSEVIETARKNKVHWLPVDHWIGGVMAHWVLEANRNLYGYDLSCWSDRIQYTVYGDKGSHYCWHADSARSQLLPDIVRKLSISLFLSDPDDYEGGEFQLLVNNNLSTYKPPRGTAVIFPSTVPHRVRPVRSGIRRTLVGWYGGPPWK
jgi:PKHD-type hydroxylase